jgi:hypothetical protein
VHLRTISIFDNLAQNFQESSTTMSAALRILNNKRKSAKLSKSSEGDVEDSRNSSSKSSVKKPRNRLRASSPPVESQLEPSSTISASSTLEVATPVAIQDQVSCLEATSQATEATLDSPPADSAIKHHLLCMELHLPYHLL